MSGPVCLITGVGPAKGTGGELSKDLPVVGIVACSHVMRKT